MSNSRRQGHSEIKVKGSANKTKDKEVTSFFLDICNGFGPRSKDKIDQLVRESKIRDVDGVMISLS